VPEELKIQRTARKTQLLIAGEVTLGRTTAISGPMVSELREESVKIYAVSSHCMEGRSKMIVLCEGNEIVIRKCTRPRQVARR